MKKSTTLASIIVGASIAIIAPNLMVLRQSQASPSTEGSPSNSIVPATPFGGAAPSNKDTVLTVATDDASKPCDLTESKLNAMPPCIGESMAVSVSTVVGAIKRIDDSANSFVAEFDLLVNWTDPRLAFNAPGKSLRQSFVGTESVDQLAKIWSPSLSFANAVDAVKTSEQALTIHADGRVVWNRRIEAAFHAEYDLNNFPFDRQDLRILLVVDGVSARLLRLIHEDKDRRSSALGSAINNDVWTFSNLTLTPGERRTINGDRASQLNISIKAHRHAAPYIPQLFLPLLVTILLPLLGLWVLDTDIHERINWAVTGVFSLIALNFSVSLQYPALGPESVVMKFFWIGYGLQCAMFSIILVVYNIPIATKIFSRWVHTELLRWMRWALPAAATTFMTWAVCLAIL